MAARMNAQAELIPTSLGNLRNGDRALIVNVGTSDPQQNARLAARGLVPGVEIGILRGGDPLLVSVDEARWAMGQKEANAILVDVLNRRKKSLFRRFWRR
jgi:Fe2+ transport system protein FeoA